MLKLKKCVNMQLRNCFIYLENDGTLKFAPDCHKKSKNV